MNKIGNNLNEDDNSIIMNGFKNQNNLEEFTIKNNNKSPESLKILFSNLKQNKKMKKLTIECI